MIYFITIKSPTGKGYVHKNIGKPASFIVGPNQTCHWYKYKRDAVAAAARFNAAHKENPRLDSGIVRPYN